MCCSGEALGQDGEAGGRQQIEGGAALFAISAARLRLS